MLSNTLPLDVLTQLAEADRRTRQVWYVAAPLRPTEEEIARIYAEGGCYRGEAPAIGLRHNLGRAKSWLSWLRRRYPAITFIAPWIAVVESGADDADPAQREAGLVDAEAVIARCDGIVLCGGRVSSGMARERERAVLAVDLTSLGAEPPGEPRQLDLSERLLVAAGRAER